MISIDLHLFRKFASFLSVKNFSLHVGKCGVTWHFLVKHGTDAKGERTKGLPKTDAYLLNINLNISFVCLPLKALRAPMERSADLLQGEPSALPAECR